MSSYAGPAEWQDQKNLYHVYGGQSYEFHFADPGLEAPTGALRWALKTGPRIANQGRVTEAPFNVEMPSLDESARMTGTLSLFRVGKEGRTDVVTRKLEIAQRPYRPMIPALDGSAVIHKSAESLPDLLVDHPDKRALKAAPAKPLAPDVRYYLDTVLQSKLTPRLSTLAESPGLAIAILRIPPEDTVIQLDRLPDIRRLELQPELVPNQRKTLQTACTNHSEPAQIQPFNVRTTAETVRIQRGPAGGWGSAILQFENTRIILASCDFEASAKATPQVYDYLHGVAARRVDPNSTPSRTEPDP